MRSFIITAAFALAATSATPTIAMAQGNTRTLAAQHTTRGDQARASRQYNEAVAEYIIAYAYDPAPERLLNIARAYEAMGSRAVALELYRRTVALARRGPAADQANQRITALGGGGAGVAAGSGTLTIMSIPPGGEIWVDGTRKGTSPMAPLPLSAGAHQVEVRLNGYQTWAKTVSIATGGAVNEMVSLMVARAGAAPAPTGTSQTLTIQNVPPGASVTLNGHAVPAVGPTASARVMSGRYTLAVKRPGFTDYIQMINVSAGENPVVRVGATAPAPGGVVGGGRPGPMATPGPMNSIAGEWFGSPIGGSSAFSTEKRITLSLAGSGNRYSGKMVVAERLELRGYKRQQCNNATEANWETSYQLRFAKTSGGGRLIATGGVRTSCSCESMCRSGDKMSMNVFVAPSKQVMASEDVIFQRRRGAIPPVAVRRKVDVNSLSGTWHVRMGSVDENTQTDMTLTASGTGLIGKTSLRKTASLGWRKKECGNRPDVTSQFNFDIAGSVSGGNVKLHFATGSPAYSECPCKEAVCKVLTQQVSMSTQNFRMSLDGNHLVGSGMMLTRK